MRKEVSMNESITCKKVSALLSLYIDNQLPENMRNFVAKHLENCESCQKAYESLKTILVSMRNSYEKIKNDISLNSNPMNFKIKEHEIFFNNISPFLDNELDWFENNQFKEFYKKSNTSRYNFGKFQKAQILLKEHFRAQKKQMPKSVCSAVLTRSGMKRQLILSNLYKVASTIMILFLFSFSLFNIFKIDFWDNLLTIKTHIDKITSK